MNILLVSAENNRLAGSVQSMAALASLLQERYGHNVLVVMPAEGNGTELLDQIGIRSTVVRSYQWSAPIKGRFRPDRLLKGEVKDIVTRLNASQVAQVIRAHAADIVHINTSASPIGAYAALATDTPLIWHIREFLEEDHGHAIRHRSRGYKLMARADRLVAISQSIYDKYEPIVGAEKLVLSENGIDPAKYACPPRDVLAGQHVRFLLVGGGQGKGHHVAIRACQLLLQRGFTDFELTLLGRFPESYQRELEELCASVPGAAERISFPGATDDTPAYYQATDVFLMCSRAEAFGRVTVEAMMGGCLVIGANTAGTADLIDDGVTGYLFENGDAEALAARIEFALANREQARAVARAGQAHMLQNMTAEANAAKVNALYAEVLRGGALQADVIAFAPASAPAAPRRAA